MMKDLVNNSHDYSFFQAVHLLEQHYREVSPETFPFIGECHYAKDERVMFAISPELGFPRSDLRSVNVLEQDGMDKVRVEVNFSGLHGSSSPLPTAYTERLAGREGEENPVRDFFDFFHNRYLSMFYRIWRKHQYPVIYESGATDRMSSILYNLVGLSSEAEIRDQMHLDWAKLLSYLGQLSTRSRSADLVSGIIRHCFNLAKVDVEEWVPREVDIDLSQQARLGQANHCLGETLHLGDTILDISSKFNLVISGIDFARYRAFLPGGKSYNELKELMRFLLIDPLAWDIKLVIDSEHLPPNCLGEGEGNHLGETTWLGDVENGSEEIIIIGEI